MSMVMDHTTAGFAAVRAPVGEPLEDRSNDDRSDETPEVASPAFDAIVASLRGSDRAARLSGNRGSPSQMFDAPIHNAHDARMQALEARDRENRLSGQGVGDTDPTSIAPRRAAKPGESAADLVGDVRLKRGVDASRSQANSKSQDYRGARFDETAVRSGHNEMGARSFDRLGLGGRATSSETSMARTKHSKPIPVNTAGAGSASASMLHATAPVFGTVAHRGGGSASVADRIAEVLSTGRIGEADTTRLSSAPSSAPGTRQSFVRGDSAAQSDKSGKHTGDAKPTSDTGGARRSEFEALVRSIRLFSGPRRSTARIQLDPPELGRIRVDLRMVDRKLEISVLTHSEAAKAVMQERADLLRTALEHHGIHVEQFDIDLDSDGKRLFDSSGGQGNDESLSSFAGMRREPAGSSASATQTREGAAEETVESHVATNESGAGERRLDIRV